MAVVVRNRSEVVGTSTSPTLAEPAGAQQGDMLVAIALSATAGAITQPAGWTSKYSGTQGGVTWVVSIISRGGSAPSLTWTVTGTVYLEVYVLCLKGGTSTTVILDSVSANGATGNSANHSPDPPATVAVATSSLAVAGGINFGGTITAWTPSANYSIQTNNDPGDDGFIETRSLTSAGSENPSAVTGVVLGAQDWWDGFTMTFTDLQTTDVVAWVSQ